MAISNRELSQFGSFIYVENSTQEIGITTGSLPYVGIGTANPDSKLHITGNAKVDGNSTITGDMGVGGNANVSGILTASSYYWNGSPLVNAEVQTWLTIGADAYRLSGNVGIGTSSISERLQVEGNVKASRFISTVSTGTAPLEVSSTTEVTNLNASLLRGGVPGANINSFDIVTLGGTQTLTHKTLSHPTITGLGVSFNGSTSGITTLVASSTAGNNTLTLPTTNGTLVSTGDTGVITSNMISDLTISNADVATGAAISYTKLNLSGSITNSDISPSAAIEVSKLSVNSISGVSLGSSLANLTAGTFVNYNAGSTYNGSSAITISVAATTTNTGSTIVSRDASGDFTAGTISVTNLTASQTVQATDLTGTNGNLSGVSTIGTVQISSGIITASSGIVTYYGDGSNLLGISAGVAITNTTTDATFYVGIGTSTSGTLSTLNVSSTNLTFNPSTGNLVVGGAVTAANGNFTGVVTATDFNSTSDINLKENIITIDNALNIVNDLRGVRFEWKKDHKPSFGIIAQELEEILPELVSDTDPKTVNYNGIIGVLIEAVKELSAEVQELKSRVN